MYGSIRVVDTTRSVEDVGLLARPGEHWEHLLPLTAGRRRREALRVDHVMTHASFLAARRSRSDRVRSRYRRAA